MRLPCPSYGCTRMARIDQQRCWAPEEKNTIGKSNPPLSSMIFEGFSHGFSHGFPQLKKTFIFPSKNRQSIRLKGVWSQAQRGASRGFLPGVGGFGDFEWRDSTLEMDGDELAVWMVLGWFWDYLWFGCSSLLVIEP